MKCSKQTVSAGKILNVFILEDVIRDYSYLIFTDTREAPENQLGEAASKMLVFVVLRKQIVIFY